MGIFSSGNKYKNAAQSALAQAAYYKNEQSDVDFRRGLLSNIRQERIARAMIEQGEYSDDISSSSTAGAIANIDSSLAGETHYAYDTTARTQKIQDLNQYADEMYRKYQKQQQRRGQAIQIGAIAAGALTGGILSGAALSMGTLMGASLGQSVGNIATGNVQEGVQGLINTGAVAYKNSQYQSVLDRLQGTETIPSGAKFAASSLDSSGKIIGGSTTYYNAQYQPINVRVATLFG